MMTLSVFFSSMNTVSLVFWPENYLRNLNSFVVCELSNLKDSVELILVKDSVMRVTIPIDLCTRSFTPLPRFVNSRRPSPLLTPSLAVILTHQSAKVGHDVCSFLRRLLGFTVHHSSINLHCTLHTREFLVKDRETWCQVCVRSYPRPSPASVFVTIVLTSKWTGMSLKGCRQNW